MILKKESLKLLVNNMLKDIHIFGKKKNRDFYINFNCFIFYFIISFKKIIIKFNSELKFLILNYFINIYAQIVRKN